VHSADISNFDVQAAPGYEVVWINMNIHNSLLTWTKTCNRVRSGAALGGEPGWAGLYFLSPGRGEFHDGTDLDAKAVKWNFDHMMDPPDESVYPRLLQGCAGGGSGRSPHGALRPAKSPIICSCWSSPAIVWVFPITSPTAFETMSEQERRSRPGGTGPFKLLEWVPTINVTLVRQ